MIGGINRLVFSEFLSAWIVVSENAKSHQSGSGSKLARRSQHFLLLTLIVLASEAWAELPINSIAIDAIPKVTVTTGPNTIINGPEVNPANSAGYLLNIQQADQKAILSGTSFDIGSASVVNINHTYNGGGAATLVRISGSEKTTIEGTLNSLGGQLYLINQNGILFGNGARVDVNGLVASALNIKDSDFLNDLGQLFSYVDGKRAAYIWGGDAQGFTTSLVKLAPDARIKSALGSSVMLFAPNVINQGSIETKEGQAVMAAGSKVYLSFAPDTNINGSSGLLENKLSSYAKDSPYRALAGVLVEVDPYQETTTIAGLPVVTKEIKSSVINDVSGRILAQRGNVTMASFMVNHSGAVVATTSVSQKGSVRLLARDLKNEIDAPAIYADGNPATPNNNKIITASQSGDLTFGINSKTLILPEHEAGVALAVRQLSGAQIGEPLPKLGEKNFTDTVLSALTSDGGVMTEEQIFNPPTLEAIGRKVTVSDHASIVVPGGSISLSAQKSGQMISDIVDSQSRLYLGLNTLIDASGLKNVNKSLDSNFIEVLLTLNDLQDNPLNKNDFLYRKNIWFDIRHLPDTRVANLGGYLKQIPSDIAEKLTAAGTVKLGSEGDLVQRTGSVVDVSGGSVNYSAGMHKETWLLDANGDYFALGKAPAGIVFTAFLNNRNYRTYWEQGYNEGAVAGSVTLNAFAMSIDGIFKGGASYGQYQRSSVNLGGSLTLNSNGTSHIDILNNPGQITNSYVSTNELPDDLQHKALLSTTMLNSSGFEDIAIKANGIITNIDPLNLAAGSALTLSGGGVYVDANIVARGGNIKFNGATIVDNRVKLDVSGLWVNDYIDSTAANGRVITKGGNVSILSAISLGQDSLLDVSGGGWLSGDGNLSKGDAGNISLGANVNPSLIMQGELRGYSLGLGGSLNIRAPFVTIGEAGIGDLRELWLTSSFFQNAGFTSYSLTGNYGVLIKGDAQVNVQAKSYQLNNNYKLAQTGEHVYDFANTSLLADFMRSSTSLTLSSQQVDPSNLPPPFIPSGVSLGSVVVQTGASLQVDSHASRIDSNGNQTAPRVEINGWDNLVYIDGTLKANGGTIAINMQGDPTEINDNDFNASQAIWLGSHAKLLAAGYGQIIPDRTGLRAGNVYDGGNISLNAKKGFIVAESGAVFDVSGGSAVLDILSMPTAVVSNGGTINLRAREGMLLDATFKAEASGALGGNLNLELGRGESYSLGLVSQGLQANYPGYSNIYSSQQWVVEVVQNAGSGFSHGLQAGNSLQAIAGGLAKVSADTINTSGLSKVTLKAADVVRFKEDVTINLPSTLRLDAPMIEAKSASNVTINAPYVILSNVLLSDDDATVRTYDDFISPSPLMGNGELNVNAQLLDLRGQISLSGLSQSNLMSTGDLRLTGFRNAANTALVGKLRTTGTLSITADQVYPTSLSDFTLSVEGAGGSVVFNSAGTYGTVLSAGGKLTVNAENINQNGVLIAPFGTIALNASQNLTLSKDSLTSVAANGALIPFGYTSRDGLDHLYNIGSNLLNIPAPPERVVKLNAPNVMAVSGSTVDISSGGDLYAYEWVPGIGGSSDVLANGANQGAFSTRGVNAIGTWAIMPANKSTFASYDTQYWNGSSVQAGDAVYLSGMPGLDAGYYTLLPARYALLKGAMLVSEVSGHQDMRTTSVVAQNDGSALVSGHLAAYTNVGYVSTSRTAGFLVRAGSDAHKLAEYRDILSSQRYAGVTDVMHSIDAGRFSVAATNSMVLDGLLKSWHDQAGRGAEVDIAAPKLLVVDQDAMISYAVEPNNDNVSINEDVLLVKNIVDGTELTQKYILGVTGNSYRNYLIVDERTLTKMSAASLLLGGSRSYGMVDVLSSEVIIGVNTALAGPEVMLAATDKVLLQKTATLTGIGSVAAARDLTIGSNVVDGNGSFLRVSAGKPVNLIRNNADRSHGDLLIEEGAVVQVGTIQNRVIGKDALGKDIFGDLLVGGAMQLDATRSMTVSGSLGFGTGGALTLAAGRVSLGSIDNNAKVTDGLWLTQEQLVPIQKASSLLLKSYTTIDLYGAVDLGNDQLDLTMQGAGLAGYQNANQTAKITALALTLHNEDKVDFKVAPQLSDSTTPASGANGKLEVSAQTIVSADNTVRLAGFDLVNLSASKQIVAQGVGSLSADKALTLSAGRVTAISATDHTIMASNGLLKVEGHRMDDLVVAPTDGNKILAPAQSAKLNLYGTSVILAKYANIVAQGAKVTLRAIGQTAGDSVTMQSGSSIIAKGSETTIKDQTIVLPAGQVTLVSDRGNVNLQSGSVVDVSPEIGANAGSFNVKAVYGNATLAGVVVGGAGATANLDVMSIVDENNTAGINQALNSLKGFSGSQSYRMRTGNAEINTDVSTKNFVLTADAGFITLDSSIDASADKGGRIELYAKNNLTLNRGSNLLAKGTADKQTTAGTAGDGGFIILSSDIGTVKAVADNLNGQTGALIDVSGDQSGSIKGQGGSVIMRATRKGVTSNSDVGTGVNVDVASTAAVEGASKLLIEAVKVYKESNINTSLQNRITIETNAFASYITNNPVGFSQARNGLQARVLPGIEVRSEMNHLTLSDAWVLGSTTPSSETMKSGGILTLRADKDLLLTKNLSYDQYSVSGKVATARPGSWNYRLVAGSDINSVNPEAVDVDSGSIKVSPNMYVRTGSGFIDAVAGTDITLDIKSAIYTQGIPDANKPVSFNSYGTNFTNGFTSNITVFQEIYPIQGGEIHLTASGNIDGKAAISQTANSWLIRGALDATRNFKNLQVRWWPMFNQPSTPLSNALLTNGVGALGGGDVVVKAGGNVSNIQFASASNGRMGGDKALSPDIANLTVNGGGDVNVNAGGNVLNVLLMAGKGEANVLAGGTADVQFELMDASAKAYSDGSMTITKVSNPTATPSVVTANGDMRRIFFYSYGKDSSVRALSALGDVNFLNSAVYPGMLYAAAPGGNVTTSEFTLYPSATGNISLLAGQDLNVSMRMSDINPDTLPQALNRPVLGIDQLPNLSAHVGSSAHMSGLLHSADLDPVRFYAGKDLLFSKYSPSLKNTIINPQVIIPKAVQIYAGRDVVDANLIIQNNKATDVSLIEAGGSIRYSDVGLQNGAIMPNSASLQIAGQGRLELIAVQNIDLGSSSGIRSVGSLYNPYLTAQGADIMVMPGSGNGLNYPGMINAYLESNPTMMAIYLPQLVEHMETRQGLKGLNGSQALAKFKSLASIHQTQFINSVFYAELRAGGRDAIDATSASFGDYTRSERAILTMFPNFTKNIDLAMQTGSLMADFKKIGIESITNPGDLILFYSQIRSEAGGGVEIMVPGGYINSGLAVAGDLNKPATDLGIVSIRGGVINAFVRNNFQVNQSRVFTLGGSDLMLYSALANIDAGRGAKTSSATPPPLLRIRNGQITYDYSSAVSGSGIAALTATGGQPGTVDLFAPYGEINAGEAGIRSAGNINLGASVIIGRENISAGGVTSGTPVASVAGLSFTPVSADANNSAKQGDKLSEAASKSANKNASALPSLITVEVLALGDDAASSSDQNSDGKNKLKKQKD